MTPHLPPTVARLAALLFGADALAAGPFSLLGLPVEAPSREAVDAALAARLEVLRSHPIHASHDGVMLDEALRMTADRLREGATRDHLVARWSPPATTVAGPSAVRSRPDPAREAALARLEADARVLLSLGSGWNPTVLRRLAWMAHARGIPSDQIAGVVRRVATAPMAPRAAMRPARPVAPLASGNYGVAVAADPDPWASRSRAALIMAGVALVSLAISAVSIVLIVDTLNTREDANAPVADAEPEVVLAEPVAATPRVPELPPIEPAPDGPAASPIAAWREAMAEPDAAAAAVVVLPRLAEGWTGLDAATRRTVVAQIVDLFYAADATRRRSMLEVLIAPTRAMADAPADGPEIRAAAFSTGVLSRLSRERDLPAAIGRDVRAAMEESLGSDHPGSGADFATAARAALAAHLRHMRPIAADASEGDWPAWIDAATAASDGNEQRDALLLVALSLLAERAPDPTTDAATLDAIRRVTEEIDWAADAPRRWLLGALSDASVSAGDLFAITGVLVRRTATTGVDSSSLIAPTAGEARRAEVREALAVQWDVRDAYARDELVLALVADAQRAIDASRGARDPEQHLAAAVRLAWCTLAAERLWVGEFDAAVEALERADGVGTSAVTGATPSRTPQDDGAWAVRYIAAGRHIGNRMALLDAIAGRAGAPLGPIDAEVLVAEAFRGSPSRVRQRAQAAVRGRSSEAVVVLAALDALPTAPATASVARLVGTLTARPVVAPSDPAWRAAARTRLVERVLELVAAEGSWAEIDLLAEDLARVYDARTRRGSDESPAAASPPPADLSAAVLRTRLREVTRAALPSRRAPTDLGRIEADREGRLGLATGPVQRLFVEQRGLAETMALLVAAERVSMAPAVERVLAALDREAGASRHVLEQVAAGERAQLRLWLSRFGEAGA